jgi:hypothetical protein
MRRGLHDLNTSIERLRAALPRTARARQALIDALRARGLTGRWTPRLVVVDVFDAGESLGIMCRFELGGDRPESSFVAPLEQIVFDHNHRFNRESARPLQGAPRRGPA